MAKTIAMTTGDSGTTLEQTLEGRDGAVANLTGATVKWTMWLKGSRLTKVSAAATVVTPAAGLVRYTWLAADVDEPGTFHARWLVTYSGGSKQSFPNGPPQRVVFEEGRA